MQPPETKAGPGGGAPEPRCIALQASAPFEYPQSGGHASPIGPGGEWTRSAPAAKPRQSALEGAVSRSEGEKALGAHETAYRDSEGRKWRYKGKRARVLDMLAASPGGITQWDCLPWHTRLGSSIHAMREDGLAISTELEGEFRHARYRLATELFGDDTPGEHRPRGLKNNQWKSNGGEHGG